MSASAVAVVSLPRNVAANDNSAEDVDLLALSRPFAREDVAESWRALVLTLLVWAAAIVVIVRGPLALRVCASVVAGLVLLRLFSFFHDHAHGAVLKRSRLARMFFHVYGWFVFTPLSVWKESHNFHHRHTAQLFGAQVGSFPVMTTAQWRSSSTWTRVGYRAMRHPLNMLLGGITVFMLGMSLLPLLRSPRRHWTAAVPFVLHAVLAALLVPLDGCSTWLAAVWLPYMLAAALGSYLFYAQHNYPGAHVLQRSTWTRHAAALESSSWMCMGPVMAWFTGNIGYHHVHHLNEAIPCYRLPEAMAAIPALHHPGATSLALADVVACLRLALWDPVTRSFVEYPHEP